ncbi:hypothetical protein ACLBUY_33845, partial [Pseudomonas aeruginosa]
AARRQTVDLALADHAYLIYNQALLQFDVGMASAGGLIAVLIANIAAIVLVRMIGKNLTERS